ncbi:MAG: tetratricopeptide repeat protein [Bacteroidetes bacterium]|nr:tetratricopeptide repeat protein [Bacteroidota bacterium]
MDPTLKTKSEKKPASSSFPDKLLQYPFAILLIFILIFIVYAQTLFFSLGKLDETNIILDHLAFLSDFHNLKEALLTNPFFNKGGDFYRPLQNLSFMIDAHLSGQNGWAYYLTNILVHGVTCSILYYLLTLFGKDKRTALLLALIFAVHPLFVQTVAWAPSRGDLFLCMFGLASFIFFIHYIRSGKVRFLLFNSTAFGLALLSKETAVIIPVICFLYYFLIEKERKVTVARLLIPLGSYLALFVLFMIIRNYVVMIVVQKGQFGILPFLVHLQTIPEFIFKFFLPLGLGPMPAFNWAYTLAGSILGMGMIALAVRFRKESGNRYLFGLAWFLLFVIPALMYINKYGAAACDYMEHRAYLPLAGILIFVYCFLTGYKPLRDNKGFQVFLVFILVVFGIYAHVYARNYKTPQSYYSLAVSNNPASAIAWFNLGATKMNFEKDYTGAIHDYNTTIRLLPDFPESYINRGFCREQLNDFPGAVSDYGKAARLKSGWYEPHVNLAAVKRKMGQVQEAIREYDTALTLSPGFYQGYNERGALRMEIKEYRAALEDFNSSIRLNEKYPEAFFNRGLLESGMQDYKSAMEDYTRAIQLNKEYVEAWVNRGVLKYQLQDFQSAIGDFSEALALDDNFAEAYLNRGMARYMTNDRKGACEDWETAKKLKIPEAEGLLQQYCRN